MAKDSVKKRLSGESGEGMSFTEFSYQLLQGYDNLHLYETEGCHLQLGGSDQWGNITTGTELIRRMLGKDDAFAITCPLITKADGTKFGKTEGGNVWLDPARTSPYKFYQFWLGVSDDDAERYIKIFTVLDREEIDALIEQQHQDPSSRVLQKRLAEEVTRMVHGEAELQNAIEASQILFSNKATETLHKIDEQTLLQVFEGVPTFEVPADLFGSETKLIDLLTDHAAVFASKGEMRKMTQQGALSINKEKVTDPYATVAKDQLLNGKYLLVQRGKKNYYLLIAK